MKLVKIVIAFLLLALGSENMRNSVGTTRGQGIIRVVVVFAEVVLGQYLKPMTCQVEAE